MPEHPLKCPQSILIVLIATICILCGGTVTAGDANDASRPWPGPIPCRIQDGTNKDLFVMTLGNVETPLADGTFDPVKDEVKMKAGVLTEHYYRDVLGVKYYG